jgi:predicted Holliday junction resolvase-like endonuclease
MPKRSAILLLILLILCKYSIVQVDTSLRKFSIRFKEKQPLKMNQIKMYILNQRAKEQRIKEEQLKLEEQLKREQEIESYKRKIIHEYLLKKLSCKTTVLKDFYSRF